MSSFPFADAPDPRRSDILQVCEAEQDRQRRRLIMIPSESICHPAAAAVLASELGNIYAEGLPQPILCHDPRETADDEARFESWRTRLSDGRFYKGTAGADRVELVAQKLIAEVFARLEGSPAAEKIHVNVQPLSGAAANLAVYEALLEPGDRLMGLDLSHGGHLTHGSEFNFSGKTYEVHSYGVHEGTRRLDYDHIRQLALAAKPKLIIGGASSYPWDFDWAALRAIADEVGAYLLADIAHLAGMIAAGVLQNPLPHAHVVMFTTHKTLCGPRGAAILSCEPEIGKRIDMAVFPGMQGGPHMNSIAAIGRLFELILEDYARFCEFQRRIVRDTQTFAARLEAQGFALEYGGTNTHMLLVDLKKFPVQGEVPLDGEIASRLLEIAGIVCNKNVLPGDCSAARASGLRFGLPWLTQRGVSEGQLGEIAAIMKSVLQDVRTMTVWSPQGEEKCRGRVSAGVLEKARERTQAIAEALPYPPKTPPRASQTVESRLGDRTALLLRGDKVRLALSQMVTARLPARRRAREPLDGRPIRTRMLKADGQEIDDVIVAELEPIGREERWLLLPHAERAAPVRQWVENLSDGYLLFDPSDLHQKVDGPTVVEEMDIRALPADLRDRIARLSGEPSCDVTKPYFIGQKAVYASAKPAPKNPYAYRPQELPLRKTALNSIHRELGAKITPFAGWEMPIQYPTGILAEHRAVRTAAGLFDVSHMGAIEVGGPHALAFLDALLANCVSRLDAGEAQYSYMLYPDGTAVDDLYVYRLERERFMLVVNAANAERVKSWISAVNSREVIIDEEMPAKAMDGPAAIRDLRDAGEDSRIDLALQGPASLAILQRLVEKRTDRFALQCLLPNAFTAVRLAGVSALVARTGYTGEKVGFEVYVHPDEAAKFWGAVVEAGKPLSALPAGLGARDSTRIEAGFPLFGHELEGDLGISMTEAGYGFVARFHVPFFIGRKPYLVRRSLGEGGMERARRHILRLRGQGRKTLRAGHVILDDSGKVAGQVTSFAYVHPNMTFFVLACVSRDFQPDPGQRVVGARISPDEFAGAVEERSLVELTALPRFPDDAEREGWRGRYE